MQWWWRVFLVFALVVMPTVPVFGGKMDEALLKRLRGNDPVVVELDLDGGIACALFGVDCLANTDVGELAEAIKHNTVLTTLHLGRNSIGNEGFRHMAAVLKVNNHLQHLDIGDNWYPGPTGGAESIDEGVQDLADALRTNTGLTTLVLKNVNINDEHARTLAEALKINNSLRTLNLYWNYISNEGARCFAEALRTNTVMITLELGTNLVSDATVLELIATALDRNSPAEPLASSDALRIFLAETCIMPISAEETATVLADRLGVFSITDLALVEEDDLDALALKPVTQRKLINCICAHHASSSSLLCSSGGEADDQAGRRPGWSRSSLKVKDDGL